MKKNLYGMLRSGLAMLLVLCMVVGFVPSTAFAEDGADTPEKEPIVYVSIGDSMTNGYGIKGYNQDEYNFQDFLAGVGMYGERAYPLQFEEYLKEQNYNVEHTKLATSGMLPEHLLYLLSSDTDNFNDIPTDIYWGFRGYDGYDNDAYTPDIVRKIKNHFQTAVAEADVISMGIGNATYGAFLMDFMMQAMGVTSSDYTFNAEQFTMDNALAMLEDQEQKELVKKIYAELLNKMGGYIDMDMMGTAPDMTDKSKLEAICDIVAYGSAMLVLSYEGILEQIDVLNGDKEQEIIIVGLMNTMAGVEFTDDNGKVVLPIGDLMGTAFSTLGAYMAALPTVMQAEGKLQGITFYFAEKPEVECFNDIFVDLYDEGKWDKPVEGVDVDTVRNRTINAVASFVTSNVGIDAETLRGAYDAVKNGTDDDEQYILSGVYKGIEKATAENMRKQIPLTSFAKLSNLSDHMSGLINFYDLLTVYANANPGPAGEEAVRDHIYNTLMDNDLAGMCTIFGLFQVGNGLSLHPTPAGHDEIAAEVINTYATGHTAKDETIKNVELVLDELYRILEECAPNVADKVLELWEKQGYEEIVNDYLGQLETTLTDRYDYYTTEALPAIESALNELNGEKAELTAELTELKAQLEAKKAELEAVLAEQEIGSIHTPNINIGVNIAPKEDAAKQEDINCNYGTENASIQNELEAAIAELEQAIATIEKLIADVDADIQVMMELAAQIKTAAEELGKTVSDVVAAGEDLYKAVEAAKEVLTNDADVTIEEVVDSFEAARDVILAAADVLNTTAGYAGELITDIDTQIDELLTTLDALYANFQKDDPSFWAKEIYGVLTPEGQTVVDVAAAIAVELEANKEEIYNALNAELAELEAEYAPKIADLEKELSDKKAEMQKEIEDKYNNEVKPAIEAEYNATIDALKEKKAALENELAGYQAELAGYQKQLAEAATAETIKQIEAAMDVVQAQIDRVNADIASVSENLADAQKHLNHALELAYQQVVEEVTAAYQKAVDALNKAIADLKAEYEAAVKALKDAAEKAIADLIAEAEKKLAELGAIGEEIAKMIEDIYAEVRDEIAAAADAIEAILNGSKEAVEDLKKALIAIGGETAEAIIAKIEEAIETIKDLFEAATTADLVIDDDFKYVAIGDGSAESVSYVDTLAEYLNTEAKENKVDSIEVVNYAKEGNTVAAERETLKERTDLADADLITIGFSHVGFLDDAMSGNTEMDWASIVGEENVSYIDELMDEVEAKIAGAAIPADMQALAVGIVEAYAYSVVAYATELPELINEINAVNSDAVIVIVGMSNPFKNITLALDETTTLDISEYVDYLVAGVAVHGTAYAILSGNAIYVDAPAAAPIYDKSEITMAEIALYGMGLVDQLYPSKDGHAYTADKIAEALNLIFRADVLWGDADGNGEIQTNDAKLILQYCAEMIGEDELDLIVSDVDGNGMIQTNDAKLILQYCAEMIDIFPVEK